MRPVDQSITLPPRAAPRGLPRRSLLQAVSLLVAPRLAHADSFAEWLSRIRPKALAKGVSPETFDRETGGLVPDLSVLDTVNRQAEFTEVLWQYLNRRVSQWRIDTGRERARQHGDLLARVERVYGVDRFVVLSIWGNESAYGEVMTNPRAMKPTLPSLGALAWREARRQAFWESEFINTLVLIEKGWGTQQTLVGSWAGALGQTQFMPSSWLRNGVDFDRDGKIDLNTIADALGSAAHYLKDRGGWQSGLPWGYEVKAADGFNIELADNRRERLVSQWARLGISRADGKPHLAPEAPARLTFPAGSNGPGFLLTQNFKAILAYNSAFSYGMAVGLLADVLAGGAGLVTPWPGAERQLTTDELQEIQRRLSALGFDTGGTDGRVGDMTRKAVQAYQLRMKLTPADGYPNEALLKQLRAAQL